MFIIIIVSFKSATLFDHTVHAGEKKSIYIYMFSPLLKFLWNEILLFQKKNKKNQQYQPSPPFIVLAFTAVAVMNSLFRLFGTGPWAA